MSTLGSSETVEIEQEDGVVSFATDLKLSEQTKELQNDRQSSHRKLGAHDTKVHKEDPRDIDTLN